MPQTNYDYQKRLDEACGDPAKIALVQAEYMQEILASFQRKFFEYLEPLVPLPARVEALEARVAALEGRQEREAES